MFLFSVVLMLTRKRVFEYCARGTLFDVLNKDNADEPLDWPRVLKLSMDIAKAKNTRKEETRCSHDSLFAQALNTLHSWVPPIVHRDLKSLNLLVDSNWTIKVSKTSFVAVVFAEGAA